MVIGIDARLEAAILAVDSWRDRRIGVTPMSVRRGERHLLIEADDELFVLRLTSPASTRPPPDLAIEVAVGRAASAAGVAPEVIASLPELGCLVTRAAPGRRLRQDDLDRPDVLASLIGSVRALHACPPPATERSVFRDADELRRVALARGLPMPVHEHAATEAIRRIERAVVAYGRHTVACHRDLTPASVFLADDHVWIVDYRWAAAGDPFEDLGSIAAQLEMSDERSDAMLALYFGAVDETRRSRLALMRMAAEYLWGIRELVETSSRAEHDARATDRHFARVVDATTHDRLDPWLGAVDPDP